MSIPWATHSMITRITMITSLHSKYKYYIEQCYWMIFNTWYCGCGQKFHLQQSFELNNLCDIVFKSEMFTTKNKLTQLIQANIVRAIQVSIKMTIVSPCISSSFSGSHSDLYPPAEQITKENTSSTNLLNLRKKKLWTFVNKTILIQ